MSDHFENILWKYFEGKASDKEINKVMDWLDENEKNRQLFVKIKKVYVEIESISFHDKGFTDKAYTKFLKRINKILPDQSISLTKNFFKSPGLYTRYAAVASFIILLGFGSYMLGLKMSRTVSNKQQIIEVPYGSKSSVILPDGSKIWLNAGSTLRYDSDFDQNSRDVFLEGEAFFDVEKRRHPFIVHTSHINIIVLGTAFNVKSYPDEDNIETTLVEGKIRISRHETSKPLYLKPNEKLTYHKSGQPLQIHDNQTKDESVETASSSKSTTSGTNKKINIIRGFNTEESTAWKDGKLVINNEHLEELVKKLERKYDINFIFRSEVLKKYSYTGTLLDFPLEQVLEALEMTSPISYSVNEKTVILSYNKSFDPKSIIHDTAIPQ